MLRLLLLSTLLLLPAITTGARISSGKRRRNGRQGKVGRRPGSESHNRHGPPVYKAKRGDYANAPNQASQATDERNLQANLAACVRVKCSQHCERKCASKIGSYLDSKWYYCDEHTHDGDKLIQPPMKKSGGKAGKGCASMGQCHGDCNDDGDCGERLTCFQRSTVAGNEGDTVPGCSVGPQGDLEKVDFCYDEAPDNCAEKLGYWNDTDCTLYATCLRDKFYADNVDSISSTIADKAYSACRGGDIDPLGPEPMQFANGECDLLLTQAPTSSPQPTSTPTTPYPTYSYYGKNGKGYTYPTPEPTDGPTSPPTKNPTPSPSKAPTPSPTRKPTPSYAMCNMYWTCVKDWEADPTNMASTTNLLAANLEGNATADCALFDDPNDKNDPLWGGYLSGSCDEHLGGYFKTCDDYWYCHEQQQFGGDVFCSDCAMFGYLNPTECGDVLECQMQCNDDMLFMYECVLENKPPTAAPTQRPTHNYLFDDYDFGYVW